MTKKTTKRRLPSAGSITDVPHLQVGHAQDNSALTGCTVILCGARGAVAGVDVRGAAPGTRETDLLDPSNLIERVHAVMLTGGSAFGLDAVGGVLHYLEEHDIGFPTSVGRVPIVPAAVIFDLAVGDARVRPDAKMGYAACEQATGAGVKEGQVGAGTGARVGKILGLDRSSPGGLATASLTLASGATVGVLVVVNAFGDIVDPLTGQILAGARKPKGRGWLDTVKTLTSPAAQADVLARHPFPAMENTTLAVVATDAKLSKAQARKVAQMAHDGLARALRPVHTMVDGDTIFALSTGEKEADVTTLGTAAAELSARAIARVGWMSRRK